jgi:hypothetical protein
MTSSTPLVARWARQGLLLTAAMVTAVALAVGSPADAKSFPASHAHIGNSSHGFADFAAHGDKFSVCDTRSDGYSVGVQWWLWKGFWSRQKNHYNYWGSFSCRSFGHSSLPEGAYVAYRACLYDNASPGGRKPVRVGGSCGPTIQANTKG